MKITLDISKLVQEGKLTREEADKLTALAAHDTDSLGINILIGFGVIAIAAGAVALVPTPLTAVSLGLALFAAGCAIVLNRVQQWILLGQICLVIGALMFGGGVITHKNTPWLAESNRYHEESGGQACPVSGLARALPPSLIDQQQRGARGGDREALIVGRQALRGLIGDQRQRGK